MKSKHSNLSVRATYRHGDLRRTLIQTGIELAREGGPKAVVLREATRRAGVAPNAAYRHFANRQALFQAVRAAALSSLALAMEEELAKLGPAGSGQEYARSSLRAVGAGYLKFAQKETGLFRTAFATPDPVEEDTDPSKAGRSGLNPYQLLGAALDRLADAGALPRARRANAEYLAWSAVHGLALLIVNGPLRHLGQDQKIEVAQRLLDMVEAGL
jgi:AcrR family transcriptional regulator